MKHSPALRRIIRKERMYVLFRFFIIIIVHSLVIFSAHIIFWSGKREGTCIMCWWISCKKFCSIYYCLISPGPNSYLLWGVKDNPVIITGLVSKVDIVCYYLQPCFTVVNRYLPLSWQRCLLMLQSSPASLAVPCTNAPCLTLLVSTKYTCRHLSGCIMYGCSNMLCLLSQFLQRCSLVGI